MICGKKRSNGLPCKSNAIKGGTVCRLHGGAAPQVRAKANERLLAMVDPALGVLARATRKRTAKNWEPSATEISAAREILNRAGIGTNPVAALTEGIETGQMLWEEFIQIHRVGRVNGNSDPVE